MRCLASQHPAATLRGAPQGAAASLTADAARLWRPLPRARDAGVQRRDAERSDATRHRGAAVEIEETARSRAVRAAARKRLRKTDIGSSMDPTLMLREFCEAVEQRDGRRFANLFCPDGVYHDVFYGPFIGRQKIAEMVDDWFYQSATDFRWDMHDPVSDRRMLYAHYTFSYKSLLPEASGARAMFEGVAMMRLRDGLIADYREVAATGTGLVDMRFAPERIVKILTRQAAALKARPEMARHLA